MFTCGKRMVLYGMGIFEWVDFFFSGFMAPIAAACIGFAAYLSGFAGGASARKNTRRPLAHPHPAGGDDPPRPARHHDAGVPHRRGCFSGLSGAGALPATESRLRWS